jgi:hypothetical protein
LGIPVIPSDQPPPVVQPAMTPLHLPAKLTDLMGLWRTTGPASAVGPLPEGYRRLNMPSPQSLSEISTIIALVGSQAGWALLGASLRLGHPHSVHHLQPHSDLGYIGGRDQKGQGQAVTLSYQVDGAALALPAVGDIQSPFLAGTKLPSRNAWLQSNLAWASRVLRNFNRMPSQTPWSCHCWSRR